MSANTGNQNIAGAVVLLMVILTVVSCKNDGIVDPPAQFATAFTGITETDSTGPFPVGHIDPDDWKPFMNCSADSARVIVRNDSIIQLVPVCPSVRPAYPNPATKYFMINFSIGEPDSVIVTLKISPSDVGSELINRRLHDGGQIICVNSSSLMPAIYRVYIKIVRPDSTYSTYGDIQVN